ncbi:MAG: hypothetical protein ACR2QO_01560 [Acidimicrobiales bacterium]
MDDPKLIWGGLRPALLGLATATAAAVLMLVAGCTADGDADDGKSGGDTGGENGGVNEAGWILEIGDEVAASGEVPPVSGTFGDPVIDRFLGPLRWDETDGAPPGYVDWTHHATLVAFGELRAGESETILFVDSVVKGEADDLGEIGELPVVEALPAEVTILIGPGADGEPNLLVEPVDAERAIVIDVLLGSRAYAAPGPSLDELIARSDVVLYGEATGNVDGTKVEIDVLEIFTGDAETLGETVMIDMGATRVDRTSATEAPPGIWFAEETVDGLRSTSDHLPGGREVVLNDDLRGLLTAG